ncbi:FAD binding domain-containing protein [Streptomyces sp. NPDC050658]|uniref:FAD binding domain-containing protein n=1 Tax=unclassified Streptomyces TaxID=2593676 RepID=UPI00342CE819
MKPAALAYYAPTNLRQALRLLAEAGPGGAPLAGGQSLIPQLNARSRRPSSVVDLNGVSGLDAITYGPDGLRIGARARLQSLLTHPLILQRQPVLAEAVGKVAHYTIRQRATLGGSLCHADPAAELPAVAVALGARLTVESLSGSRCVIAADFFTGPYSTSLHAGELLTYVEFPPLPQFRFVFAEVSRRTAVGLPLVALCLGVSLEEGVIGQARAAAAGVADRPVRLTACEEKLRGLPLGGGGLDRALAAVGEGPAPPSDQHGNARYRTALLRSLLCRCADRLRNLEALHD